MSKAKSIDFNEVTSNGNTFYPLNKTVADLNMDALGNFGETNNFSITGKGQNDLDDYVVRLANEQEKKVTGDKNPSAGGYYRSDHFNFAKVGIPALDINTGEESVSHGAEWGKKKQNEGHFGQERQRHQIC